MLPEAPEKRNGEVPGEVAGAVAVEESELGEDAASVAVGEEPGATMATKRGTW